MIRDIDEFKERLIRLATYEHSKRIVDAWLSGRDTDQLNKYHNEFMEKMNDDEFVNEQFLNYLKANKR